MGFCTLQLFKARTIWWDGTCFVLELHNDTARLLLLFAQSLVRAAPLSIQHHLSVDFVRVTSLSRFRFTESTHISVSLPFQSAIYTPDHLPARASLSRPFCSSALVDSGSLHKILQVTCLFADSSAYWVQNTVVLLIHRAWIYEYERLRIWSSQPW